MSEKRIFNLNHLRVEELALRFQEIERQLEAIRSLYDEKDSIAMELQSRGILAIDLGCSRSLIIRDNFKETNVVFRPAAVRRFEAIILEPKKAKKEIA